MSSLDDSASEVSAAFSDEEIDIFSSLAGPKSKTSVVPNGGTNDSDEELSQLIHSSISKHRVKTGASLLKKTTKKISKGQVGGGSFQNMGLHPSLLRSLTLQGFRIPTPIQRLTIPPLLSNPPQDLVGMARTGSGKTLAYMIPLVQRLGGLHATTFGARALILVPTRELALQVLKVGKELVRGWHSSAGGHAGDRLGNETNTKHSQSLKWGLVVGGEGLDEQFDMISSNPDIIIATPGRLLHLVVEMNLDLKSVNYVVFDEADRLFELGFELSLTEIVARLPTSRQTLLFSATLPKSLVEFAKAGLKDPKLVRLDAESKISPDLKMAFFAVKNAEKDACLMSLLRDIIRVPLGTPAAEPSDHKGKGKSRHTRTTAPEQTLIFAATKHHVEYLTTLLITSGYSVSHIYGSLDQHARTFQMDQFRGGHTNILVVTDVAARGIDIPVLENVINYDFPHGARIFVHRVGRTARAGRQGWAWSLVTHQELPYLLDLQLFLGRPLVSSVSRDGNQAFTESLILGPFEREQIDQDVEYVRSLDSENSSLPTLRQVMVRGHSMYERSKGKASPASYTRAKAMTKDPKWGFSGSQSGIHPVLLRGDDSSKRIAEEDRRKTLLKAVNSFTPAETVLENGSKGSTDNAVLMSKRRKALGKSVARQAQLPATNCQEAGNVEDVRTRQPDLEMADEEDIAVTFSASTKKRKYEDSEFYMSHHQKDASTEKGYSLRDGAAFAEQAASATFDLAGDEAIAGNKRKNLQWDKKKKNFVQGGGVGSDNVKMVKTENGTRLPATYRSGRFDEWKAKTRKALPRVGEAETEGSRRAPGGKKFRHQKIVAPKPLDKFAKDYDRKIRQLNAQTREVADSKQPSQGGKKATRFSTKPIGRVKSEIKTNDQIRKTRKLMEKRRGKNARPSKKGFRKGKH